MFPGKELKRQIDKNQILMDEYIPSEDTRHVFRSTKYSILMKNYAIFSHSGSCIRIPYLNILKNRRKLHLKSPNICSDKITECECN